VAVELILKGKEKHKAPDPPLIRPERKMISGDVRPKSPQLREKQGMGEGQFAIETINRLEPIFR